MTLRPSRLRGPPVGDLAALNWTEAVRRHAQVTEDETDDYTSPQAISRSLKTTRDMPAYKSYLQERRKSMRGSLEMMGVLHSHHNQHQVARQEESTLTEENPYMYDFNKSMQQMWEAGARQGHRGSLTGRMLDIANNPPQACAALSRRSRHRTVAPLERYTSRNDALRSINEDQEISGRNDDTEDDVITANRPTHRIPSAKLSSVAKFRRKLRKRRSLRKKNSTENSPGTESPAQSYLPRWRRQSLITVQGKLRKLVRFVILLLRTWRHHSMRTEDVLSKMEAMDMLVDKKDKNESDLLFDLSVYKAHREAPISMEARRIMMKEPGTRTEPELHYVQVALRNYRSIAEYPVRIQRLLTERCYYQRYRAKRVIIREGYLASHFYFLLSGSVVVSLLDVTKGVNKTLYFLSRGDSFGELALVNQARREITVVSKEDVELLVLNSEDFTNIFLSGGLNEPFLRTLPFLEGWPLEYLEKNTKKAIFSFFKRDAVLTNDSRRSEWIYIVKSGSCRLLKRLKPEKTSGRQTKKLALLVSSDEDHEMELTRRYSEEVDRAKASGKLTTIGQPELNIPTDDVNRRHKYSAAQVTDPRPESQEESHQNSVPASRQTSFVLGSLMKGPFLSATPSISRAPSQVPLMDNNIINVNEAVGTGKRSQENADIEDAEGTGEGIQTAPRGQIGQKKGVRWEEEEQEENSENKNVSQYAVGGFIQTPASRRRSARVDSARFVVVQVLTKGNVFGLEDVMCGDQPGFSLVSNGAEVIMIQKRFYIENAPQSLINKLRTEVYPYPTEKELQRNLRQQLNWDSEKRATLHGTVNKLRMRKMDIHDSRTRITVT